MESSGKTNNKFTTTVWLAVIKPQIIIFFHFIKQITFLEKIKTGTLKVKVNLRI